jgi:hypothetical protein
MFSKTSVFLRRLLQRACDSFGSVTAFVVCALTCVALMTPHRVEAAVISFASSSSQITDVTNTLTLTYTSNFLSDNAVGITASTGLCSAVAAPYVSGGVFLFAGVPSGVCVGGLENSTADQDPAITTNPQVVAVTVPVDDFATIRVAVGHGGTAWILRSQFNSSITTFSTIVHPVRLYSAQVFTITALDEAASFTSAAGGSINVRSNDSIDFPANAFNTTYSILNAGGLTGVTFNNATGNINVPGGQPVSGVRTIVYQVCQAVTNTTNCVSANAVVTLSGTVAAGADSFGATSAGGTFDLLVNDTLNGVAATVANTSISLLSSGGVAGASINPAGQLVIPPGVAPGTYTLTYRLCENPGTTNCVNASVALTIIPGSVASNDIVALPPSGGVVDILANDAINGASANLGNADVTLLSNGGISGASVNTIGQLVIPAGLPSGVYILSYRLCEKNTTNCETANVNVTVLAALSAAPDSAALPVAGGTIDILANDTVGGLPAAAGNADVTLVSNGGAAGAAINVAGGLVIPAGLAIANYTLTYRLCQKATTNCATGTVALVITPPISANNDGAQLPGTGGVVNILDNDLVNGQRAAIANVDVSLINSGGISGALINAQGALAIPGGLRAGLYTLQYRLCQKSSTTCSTANVSITIIVTASTLSIRNDRISLPPSGGVIDVLANDTFDGRRPVASELIVTLMENSNIPALTINASNGLVVPSGLAGGAYQVTYRACQRQLPSNCGTATVFITITVSVVAAQSNRPPSVPGATNASASVTIIGPSGNPVSFPSAAGSNVAGAVNDPLTFSNVKLVFGNNESGPVQMFYSQTERFSPFGAQLYYSGSGTLRGRWEVVFPGDSLPTELDLFPEAGLPPSLRSQQQRYFLIDRIQQFLTPLGRHFLVGPDPSRLPRTVPGQYLILLRIEATPGTSGAEGGRAAFAFPALRYFVQGSTDLDEGEGVVRQDRNRRSLTGSGANAAEFSLLGEIPRGAITLESSSLRPNAPGQGFVGLGPKPMSLMLPLDAANLGRDKPMVFTWVDVADATLYRFELETAAGKSLVVASIKPGISSYSLPPPLVDDVPPGMLVRWRVLAIAQGGMQGKTVGISAWRSVRLN